MPDRTLKSGYINLARGAGQVFDVTGLSGLLDRLSLRFRWAHWLRSLPAIDDLDSALAMDKPRWTYDAIDWVEAFLAHRPAPKVFEYGSGVSTLWLARRASEVVSVEHDRSVHARVAKAIGRVTDIGTVALRLVEPDQTRAEDPCYGSRKSGFRHQTFRDYVRAIDADPDARFDLIVIDGRARTACLHAAVERLSDGGMVVFVNSGRRRYRRALQQCDLQAVALEGWTPFLPYRDETLLLTRCRTGG